MKPLLKKFHPDFIEEVKQRADIVEVIGGYVELKKQGKEFAGCCPFHNENTPSFTVSPSKGLAYCFGCSWGGNAIKFLMEVGRVSFANAVLDLARFANIPSEYDYPDPLPRPLKPKAPVAKEEQKPAKDYTVDEWRVNRSVERLLSGIGDAAKALGWLQQRGISREMVKRYRLGLEKRVVTPDESIPEVKETYWAIAIFIPVADRPGRFYIKKRVCPWLTDDERPDYLSKWAQFGVPATIWFTHNPKEAQETRFCEGEWDAILLGELARQRGEKVAICCSTSGCGTVPKPEELERLPGQATIFYDRDEPGEKGAQKLAAALQGRGRIASVPMPSDCQTKGWDASDAIRAGYGWEDFEAASVVIKLNKTQSKEYAPFADSTAKFRVKRGANDLEQFLESFLALSEKDGQEWLKLRQFTPDETINSEYFYHEPPHEGEGLAVNSGLGTGKSFYTNEHYIGEDDGAIFLGNRNTVIEQFVENAKERHGLNWYLIQQDLKEGGRDDLRLIQDPQSKIISCIDSILYIQPQDAVDKKCVFDEVESTLKHLNYSTTAVSYRRQLCKQRLAEITTEAHSLLLCDGNLKNITVSYMEKLSGKKFRKVKNLYKGNRGKVTYYIGSERFEKNQETNKWETVERRLNDYSLLLNTIMEDPDPFIVGSDSQEQLEAWDKQLKAKGRKTFRLDGTNSNSPEAKKFIRNPAKYIYEHGIDVVLYSPSADQGLSIDMKVELEKTIVYLSGYFKRGYFFFLGVVLTDIQIQFLGRLRDGGCHLHVYCQVKHKDANSINKGLLSEGIQEFCIEYARDCATLSLSDVDEENRSQKMVELAHKLIEKSNDIHYLYECQLLAMAYFEQNNLRNCLEYAMREAGWQVEVVTGRKVSTTELDAIKASIRAERSEKILAAAPLTASEAQKIERAGIPNEEDKPRIIRHKLLQRIPGIDSKVITEKKIVRVPVSDAEKNAQNQVGLEAESLSQQGLDPVHIPPSNSINHEGVCGQHEVSDESLPNLTPLEAGNPSGQGLDPVQIPPSNSINHEGGCGQTEAFVEVEQEVTRSVFDADFIKRVKFQDRGLISRLEGQGLLRNPHVAKLTQQKKWQKKLALFQDDQEVDGVKRLNLTTYKSPWLKISTLIEMGIEFFLNPESSWTQETPEAIAFWERGKDPKIAQLLGLEVGDSDVCKFIGRVLDSYGVKREAEKISLPSGVRVRQYRTKPLDPICQAIYDCVEAKILALTGEEETVLSWVQIVEKAPSPEAENPSEQGLDPVHIPPSNSINHEGGCGQADQAEPTLEKLIDRLAGVNSPEQFWQVVRGCSDEQVEDAILFQSLDIRYQMRAWYEAGAVADDTANDQPLSEKPLTQVAEDTSERPPLSAYKEGDEVWAFFPQCEQKWRKAVIEWVRGRTIRVIDGFFGMYIERPELIAPGDWELVT